MTPKLSDDQRRAMEQQPGKPVTIEDDQTHYQYVIIPMETFQKVQALIYDDAEFDPREAYPLIDEAFGGPDGWDAPGMEVYDNYDDHRPQS